MSIFALSITPYITSSIIIQLLTIAIPTAGGDAERWRRWQERKSSNITRYVTVALALIEGTAMTSRLWQIRVTSGKCYIVLNMAVVVVVALTAGSAFLMWIGERITEKGVGNGISIVLMINILSSMPG